MLKKKIILDIYMDNKTDFLDTLTLLMVLEKRGFKMTKKELTNFINENLENLYLVPSKDPIGNLIGWTYTLIKTVNCFNSKCMGGPNGKKYQNQKSPCEVSRSLFVSPHQEAI